MDFFEALGFKRYQGSQFQDDTQLRKNYIDRIYDTYIDEEELQACDQTICDIANTLEPRSYTSREFIKELGKYLKSKGKKKDSKEKEKMKFYGWIMKFYRALVFSARKKTRGKSRYFESEGVCSGWMCKLCA